MNISDLNYLEVVNPESGITGAGGTSFNTLIKKDVKINSDIKENVVKNVTTTVNLQGNLAKGQISADAFGNNTLTEANVFLQATANSSQTYIDGTAAVN